MSYFTSQVQSIGADSDADFVYYTATLVNNSTATEVIGPDPSAVFQDTRDNAVVKDASKYEVSVENFSLNGATKFLPVLIPSMQSGSSTLTNYSVTWSVSGGGRYSQSTQPIVWVPENANLGLSPANPEFFYEYSYAHWATLVNAALRAAYAACKADILAKGTTIASTCPFFEYDETTGLFSLIQDANTAIVPYGTSLPAPYSEASTAAGYSTTESSFVGFDTNLEGLLSNFNSIYYGVGVTWGGGYTYPQNVVQVSPSQLNNKVFSLSSPFGNTYSPLRQQIRVTQDFVSTGSLWSPVSSIVIATQQIPVRSEHAAPPIQLGASNTGAGSSGTSAFQRILVEYTIDAITADKWRGFILYEPLVPTFSSLGSSQQEIKSIDFQVYFRNRLTNALVPLAMYNLGSMSVRLLFKKIGA